MKNYIKASDMGLTGRQGETKTCFDYDLGIFLDFTFRTCELPANEYIKDIIFMII